MGSLKTGLKEVKPILSLNHSEARRRVLNLYRGWYRQLPYIAKHYDMPKNVCHLREKLREEFTRHDYIRDVRVIDMMVIKGQMELKEIINGWKQKSHIMRYFKESVEPKPTDFLGKFYEGFN